MKTFIKYLLLLTFSGYMYVCIELLYRGHSDISMMFCASICAIPIIILNNIFTYEFDFLMQVLYCTIYSTLIEYITGITINKNYTIWDYRNMPFNVHGQICLPFILIWMIFSIVLIPLMDWIDWKVFDYEKDTPPYYKIFGKKIYQFRG